MQSSNHRTFNIVAALDILIYNYINWGSYILLSIGIILSSSLPDKIEKIGLKHRGISHSIIFYGILWFLLSLYLKNYAYMLIECCILKGILIGCFCHILADMFSHNGIILLGAPLKFNLYTTGNKSETIFLWVVILLNFFILYLNL
jgi:membrane-bound metal-dependent hydrolase YbcI (DUF457 family)